MRSKNSTKNTTLKCLPVVYAEENHTLPNRK